MKRLIIRYLDGIKNNYCPICGAKLSYWRKIFFLDWRYLHKCPKCKKYLTVKYSRILWFVDLLFVLVIIILCILKKLHLFKFVLIVLLLFLICQIVLILPFLSVVND